MTSGGVTTAASVRMPTTAYLRTRRRPSASIKPALPISVRSTGNWKQRPKATINFNVISSVSFTLPLNTISMPVLFSEMFSAPVSKGDNIDGRSAKPRKKRIASGVTIKWANIAPIMNNAGEATMKGKNADFSLR